ncbi:hypothetical protein TRVA0_005S00914 [Trichomonascus vanleenenianus]|uniref:uncharacterized protein n=1 Tax=Trichomonascus vanleenenianus TaxID=2268995 RepID=UPI003EC9681D
MKWSYAVCALLAQLCIASLSDAQDTRLGHYDQAFRLVKRWESAPLERRNNSSSEPPLQVGDPDKLDALNNSANIGGSSYPYNTGSTSPKGLPASGISLTAVTSHYPGYWGGNAGVDVYSYAVSLMNNTLCIVDCYCIRGQKCTCDRVDRQSYFTQLSYLISFKEVFSNYTQFYINGTMPLPGELTSSAPSTYPACLLALILACLTVSML